MFNKVKPMITTVFSNFSNLLEAEIALINIEGEILECTKMYKEQKGELLHIDSILKASQAQFTFFDKPGEMDICNGCRFQLSCPVELEVLAPIQVKEKIFGILSITFFKNSQKNMTSNKEIYYMNILSNLIEIITNLLLFVEESNNKLSLIESALSYNKVKLIITDRDDNIIFNNTELNYSKMNISSKYIKNFDTTAIFKDRKIIGHLIQPKIEKIKEHLSNSLHNDPKIEKFAKGNSTILLTGETGTGKSSFAKKIHTISSRNNKPFISVNCASLAENLFESELFGYTDGAFTGSKKGGKSGFFENAHGGTLFLDEIAEIPNHLQVKLLQVIEDKFIIPIGSTTPVYCDVRIIVATNKNLIEEVNKGNFRADLFYRINIINICLPALRKEIKNIKNFIHTMINKYNHSMNKNVSNMSMDAIQYLKAYHWPGNLRELDNCIEYAMNLVDSDTITSEHLPSYIKTQNNKVDLLETENEEYELIKRLLDSHGHSLTSKENIAKKLNISLRTLYRRLEKYNLQ